MRVRKLAAAALFVTLIAAALCSTRAVADAPAAGGDDLSACGLQSGTLTTVLTPDNNADFVVFGLYNSGGDEIARQYIPIYNPDASAELMVTPIGFGGAVASVKCLDDPGVKRCSEASWLVDEGLKIGLVGLVVGPDFAIAAINGRYKNPSNTGQLAIDGGIAGFQLDNQTPQWSAFFNSETLVSQAFFGLKSGEHSITFGTRDPETLALTKQERICFRS